MRVTKAPKTWHEAFGMLQEHLAKLPSGKKVLFIDELSWLDTPKSNFISALEHFWNGWATARPEKDIVLIVCGSATSWIVNKVVRNHGGLHNRLTMKIFLQPFTLYECKQFAEHLKLELTDRDLLEAYMILGGIPVETIPELLAKMELITAGELMEMADEMLDGEQLSSLLYI